MEPERGHGERHEGTLPYVRHGPGDGLRFSFLVIGNQVTKKLSSVDRQLLTLIQKVTYAAKMELPLSVDQRN